MENWFEEMTDEELEAYAEEALAEQAYYYSEIME